jgi:hypothetical protein
MRTLSTAEIEALYRDNVQVLDSPGYWIATATSIGRRGSTLRHCAGWTSLAS